MADNKKSLFSKMLTASDKDIRGKRAELTVTQAQNYADKKVRDLEDEILEKEQELARLEDIERSNSTSLAVTKNGFDHKVFIDTAYQIELDLIELKVKLGAAQKLKDKYFG